MNTVRCVVADDFPSQFKYFTSLGMCLFYSSLMLPELSVSPLSLEKYLFSQFREVFFCFVLSHVPFQFISFLFVTVSPPPGKPVFCMFCLLVMSSISLVFSLMLVWSFRTLNVLSTDHALFHCVFWNFNLILKGLFCCVLVVSYWKPPLPFLPYFLWSFYRHCSSCSSWSPSLKWLETSYLGCNFSLSFSGCLVLRQAKRTLGPW